MAQGRKHNFELVAILLSQIEVAVATGLHRPWCYVRNCWGPIGEGSDSVKARLRLLAGMILAFMVASAWAEKPLKDYSFVRGVNNGVLRRDQSTLERDLGYGKRLNLNSTRIWLSYRNYEANPQDYTNWLRDYIRTAHRLGYSTMPILFNGNGLDPATLKPDFRLRGDAYVKAIVEAIKDEPGLLMWDVMNEPLTNPYYGQASEQDKKIREAEITEFVRYYIGFVKKVDPVNAATVGYGVAAEVTPTADLVDVITFHEYTPRRATIEASYRLVEETAKKFGKPIMNSETGCIARANPYDVVLQISEQHKTGWYLFELMIEGGWASIHGLFYQDGTIRDPAIIAAVIGFYRNRDLGTIVRPLPNREGQAAKAIHAIEEALLETPRGRPRTSGTEKLLDAAEYAVNLLESGEMVPMDLPPSAQIQFWRRQPEEQRDVEAIRAFAYDMAKTLKRKCLLL